MVKKYYAGDEARSGLLAQIAEEKVIAFLLEKSKVKEVAPAKEADKAPAKKTAKKTTKKTTKKKSDSGSGSGT
jgi:hypothetical protein